MGLLSTRWEASFEGHNITVSRNEILRGFAVEWDGREIARRTWSLAGLGELQGSAEVDGKKHDVRVLSFGSHPGGGILSGMCEIFVDGAALEVRQVR